MAGKTQTRENAVLNTMRGTTYTGFNAYAGLLTTAATDTTSGTEVSGSSYARQLAGFGAPSGNPASMSNAAEINFPVVTSSSYAPVQIGIYDASSAGNIVGFVPAFSAVTIAVGGQARIAAGGLVATED